MKENKIYIVIKMGVYIQGIAGVFDDKELAIKAGKQAIEDEGDSYHNFYIIGKTLNAIRKYTYNSWTKVGTPSEVYPDDWFYIDESLKSEDDIIIPLGVKNDN